MGLRKKKVKGVAASGAAKETAARPSGPMDVGLLQKIVELMAANDLNTVDVREGEKRIILKRGAAAFTTQMVTHSHDSGMGGAVPATPAVPMTPAAGGGAAEEGMVSIKSPMVGSFYVAGSPGDKPFVNVGSVINEDTDVCIVVAMKVNNTIKAEVQGTIVKVLVDNGDSVEFGTPLFLVKQS